MGPLLTALRRSPLPAASRAAPGRLLLPGWAPDRANYNLALRLNIGESGIIAGKDAPGCVLECEPAAAPGTVPLWGQTATFEITVLGMPVRIELEGIFGIGAAFIYWPGFAAHAVDYGAPFISDTGYRSFLGIYADPVPELAPDAFAARIIEDHIDKDLKGRLVRIDRSYRGRCR